MEIHAGNNCTATILVGDCAKVLKTLHYNSIDCVVTSPPYFGVRDYGTSKWDGGDPGCNHLTGRSTRVVKDGRDICPTCGAIRVDDQIGLEASPKDYATKIVDIFRDIRNVLNPNGTVWLNLGDVYASKSMSGFKAKEILSLPWRIAIALQDDGWYLRQDIIWHKSNAIPEPVKDRCTRSHEYIFLLTKSEKYYCNMDAIKEPATGRSPGNKNAHKHSDQPFSRTKARLGTIEPTSTRNKRSVWTIALNGFRGAHFATFPEKLVEPCVRAGCPPGGIVLDPFGGAGTTAVVANREGRNAIMIELNPEYAKLAENRLLTAVTKDSKL